MKIVNVFQPLTIFTKRSILHVSQSSKYVSDYDSMCYVDKRFNNGYDFLSLLCFNSDIRLTSETRLHHDLIETNTKRLLTFPLLKGALLVKIGLSLIQVIDIAETNEVLVINTWMWQV